MTVSTLRPNGTVISNGVSVVGAANEQTATSDDTDASYVQGFGDLSFVVLDLDDFALPTGAIIKNVKSRVRTARLVSTGIVSVTLNDGLSSTYQSHALSVSWTAPTTTTAPEFTGLTDANVDALTIGVSGTPSGNNNIRWYEAYVDVTYVAKPVVSADLPTGTVTDTNLPTIVWSNTLDSDGGAQTRYQIRLFTDAQYLAGGFDPAISAATVDTGEVSSAALSWQATQTLPDDVYRAYVRVAQTVNGQLHWSAYDFTEFTIDVDLPGTPTLTATADNANARIELSIIDTPAPVVEEVTLEAPHEQRDRVREALLASEQTGFISDLRKGDEPLVLEEAQKLGIDLSSSIRPLKREERSCLRWAVASAYRQVRFEDTPANDFVAEAGFDPVAGGKLIQQAWRDWAAERGLAFWHAYDLAPVGLSRWIAVVARNGKPGIGHAVSMTGDRLLYDPAHGTDLELHEVRVEDVREALVLSPVSDPIWRPPVRCRETVAPFGTVVVRLGETNTGVYGNGITAAGGSP